MEIKREEKEKVLFGESAGEATIGGITFPIPYPILTSTDVNYSDYISNEYSIPVSMSHQLHESKEHWWPKKFKAYQDSEARRKELVSWIDVQIQKAESNSKAKVFMYTPVLNNTPWTEKVRDFFVHVQMDSDLTVVNVPDPSLLTGQRLSEDLKKIAKEICAGGKEPFLLHSVARDGLVFEGRMTIAKEVMRGATTLYSNPKLYFENFKTLAKFRDKEFIRVLSNVERTYPKFGSGAVAPIAFLCSDLFSSKLGMGGGKKKEMAKKELTNARRFDVRPYGYLTVSQHKTEYGEDLGCTCAVDNGRELTDVTIEMKGDLYAAFRAHEPHAIFEGTEQIRDKIRINQLKSHLEKKSKLKDVLLDLFQIEPTKQTKLPLV
jgi:hypothetical protein